MGLFRKIGDGLMALGMVFAVIALFIFFWIAALIGPWMIGIVLLFLFFYLSFSNRDKVKQ
jgi:uncharacterized membrane protein YfcA